MLITILKKLPCNKIVIRESSGSLWSVLWSRDHGLENRVHSSSFLPGLGLETWWPKCLGLGLETWRPRSRSWSQDSVLDAYACSTITVICSTFKRVLCHQLELMQPVLWSRDSSALKFILSRSRSRDLKTQVLVSVLVSRPNKDLHNNTGCDSVLSWRRERG